MMKKNLGKKSSGNRTLSYFWSTRHKKEVKNYYSNHQPDYYYGANYSCVKGGESIFHNISSNKYTGIYNISYIVISWDNSLMAKNIFIFVEKSKIILISKFFLQSCRADQGEFFCPTGISK